MNRARRRRETKDFRRKFGQRGQIKNLILIVCESKQTEPNYFRGFKLTNVDVDGAGADPMTVVERAKEIVLEQHKLGKNYDQIWCVFDRDDFPAERFNNAIITTRQLKNFHSAYSNEAFELWYVLHFEYLNSGIMRQDYIKKLNEYLDCPYKKNDPTIYQLLLEKGDQQYAIRNAERLLACYSPSNPCEDNPSTTVHELVKVLNQYKLKVH